MCICGLWWRRSRRALVRAYCIGVQRTLRLMYSTPFARMSLTHRHTLHTRIAVEARTCERIALVRPNVCLKTANDRFGGAVVRRGRGRGRGRGRSRVRRVNYQRLIYETSTQRRVVVDSGQRTFRGGSNTAAHSHTHSKLAADAHDNDRYTHTHTYVQVHAHMRVRGEFLWSTPLMRRSPPVCG